MECDYSSERPGLVGFVCMSRELKLTLAGSAPALEASFAQEAGERTMRGGQRQADARALE